MGCPRLTYKNENFLRVAYSKKEETASKIALDYFSGGMPMPNRNVVGDYRYNYQGEELDQETGKVAFELRLYDPRINRWLTTDPKREFHSPYLAMGNNWMNKIDPDGGSTASPDDDYKLIDGKLVFWRENKNADRIFNADGTEQIGGDFDYGTFWDGLDFKNDYNLINIEGQFANFIDTYSQISGIVGKENGALFFSEQANGDISHTLTGAYKHNEFGHDISVSYMLKLHKEWGYTPTQSLHLHSFYHSHPFWAQPSDADLGFSFRNNLPGIISSTAGNMWSIYQGHNAQGTKGSIILHTTQTHFINAQQRNRF